MSLLSVIGSTLVSCGIGILRGNWGGGIVIVVLQECPRKRIHMGMVIKNRGTSCVGVRKTGTTLTRVFTVMGTL